MTVKQQQAVTEAFGFFNEIGIIAQLASNEFERALPAEMTQAQFSVLNWFSRVDTEASPSRLALAFQVTKGAMTNTLKKLEAKGYIEVNPDSSSGRQKIVTITTAGQKARNEALKMTAPLMQQFLEQIPLAQVKSQLPLLQAVRAYLDERRFR